jgi:hypothetical protein
VYVLSNISSPPEYKTTQRIELGTFPSLVFFFATF